MSGDAPVRCLVYYKTEASLHSPSVAVRSLSAPIYAVAGTFVNPKQLAIDAANTVKTIEGVPDIPMFRQNTAAFVHSLPAGTLANVDGDEHSVRVQVLTNEGALDRAKQVAVVEQLTKLVSTAAGDDTLKERT